MPKCVEGIISFLNGDIQFEMRKLLKDKEGGSDPLVLKLKNDKEGIKTLVWIKFLEISVLSEFNVFLIFRPLTYGGRGN